ncbi:MAG: NAD(P)(+) transhydrogenase (Re/Si-specific) subunit beta [Ferrimicrobium sp.]|jgi:NAD(P) transhydrogenase subunit beta|uniref:NAD(P) transhydrogenase subunit beta n=3 Tax=Ferrimicrobium TaxID=121038 RepID=A0ABV3Y1J7_9ACTN|nr:NAD(P)(+) transhydrogenase (Re/Si-specific) subunit beta [Ferrimicrobium sp.]
MNLAIFGLVTHGITLQQGVDLAYLVAAIGFILGLKQLSSPRSARKGNSTAAVGMAIALVASLFVLHPSTTKVVLILIAVAIGTVVGAVSARKVAMTAIPQMVAAFNGVGGAAAALVSIDEYMHVTIGAPGTVSILAVVFSVVVGSVSFAGSIIAFLKLQELMSGTPITYPGQRVVNGILVLGILALVVYLVAIGASVLALGVLLVISLVLGLAFVLPIGGADMPVVISMLNAFTGVAVAASGFAIGNTGLIVGGTLVGASGTLLTKMMSDSMGRSLGNVLFAAVGKPVAGVGESHDGSTDTRSYRSGNPEDIGVLLAYSKKVVIVPGYGLAVAQAQHVAKELALTLEQRGIEVHYAIHPVAGRMPGHMNVLLAEADVPYEQLKEMDAINDDFQFTDVVLVVGANDVVNPAAREVKDSPIYGMPILNADRAKNIIFLKRSMRPGFAGIDNPLMYDAKTIMLFGDAKDSLTKLVAAVKAA